MIPNPPSPADISRVLEQMVPPQQNQNIVALGWVQGIQIREGGALILTLELPTSQMTKAADFQKDIQARLQQIPGIQKINILLTTHRKAPPPPTSPPKIPGITSIVAVASGKGGVGKSTTTLNLAIALSKLSLNVGILDADIYGPSLPTLLNLKEKPLCEEGTTLIPLKKYGLTCMSMGFLIPEEKAAIWRGPMIHSALKQMLLKVEWGRLHILLIDLPPGTGDIPLSLAQLVPLTGAVIVSTPQDLALLDARRGMEMFHKIQVPLLGLIENMSAFTCPFCQGKSDIFNSGGARAEAEKRGIPFLGEIPLHATIREACDRGLPLALSHPQSPEAKAYEAIAKKIL